MHSLCFSVPLLLPSLGMLIFFARGFGKARSSFFHHVIICSVSLSLLKRFILNQHTHPLLLSLAFPRPHTHGHHVVYVLVSELSGKAGDSTSCG